MCNNHSSSVADAATEDQVLQHDYSNTQLPGGMPPFGSPEAILHCEAEITYVLDDMSRMRQTINKLTDEIDYLQDQIQIGYYTAMELDKLHEAMVDHSKQAAGEDSTAAKSEDVKEEVSAAIQQVIAGVEILEKLSAGRGPARENLVKSIIQVVAESVDPAVLAQFEVSEGGGLI